MWKRNAIRVLWALGGASVLGLAFVLSFFAAMKGEMRSTEVVVPDLAGLTAEEAARISAIAGLVIEVIDRRFDPSIPSGRIQRQDPQAGTSVRSGRKIKLVLSLGGEVLTVPDLVGQGARAAEHEIARQGLALGSEARAYSSRWPAGQVIAQVPPIGMSAMSGIRVHRLVSEGPPQRRWVMPDLVGRSREVAETWTQLHGFRRGPVRLVDSPGRPPGTVVGQLPLSGHPVAARDVVELTVAK